MRSGAKKEKGTGVKKVTEERKGKRDRSIKVMKGDKKGGDRNGIQIEKRDGGEDGC
jgi:hypothetical protein